MSADEAEVDDAIRSLLRDYTIPPMTPPQQEPIPARKRRKRKRIVVVRRPVLPFHYTEYLRLLRWKQQREYLDSIQDVLQLEPNKAGRKRKE